MNRYVHVDFCDDIRQELGGKTTLVGVYSGEIYVPEIPCTLPKLCMAITIGSPKSRDFKLISISAFFNGNEVVNMRIEESQIKELMSFRKPDPKRSFMTLLAMAMMSPFKVDTAGKLTLSVVVDGESLNAQDINISLAPPGTEFAFE